MTINLRNTHELHRVIFVNIHLLGMRRFDKQKTKLYSYGWNFVSI